MRISIAGILVCFTLTACGTKGPLYIPEKQYPQGTSSGDSKEKIPSPKSPKNDSTPY
ncbi:MAG: lipoprotein [Methylophilaceae bacterium]